MIILAPIISTVVSKKTNFNFNLNHIINPRNKVKSLSSSMRMINLITAAATTLTTLAFFSHNNVIRTSHSFCFTTTTNNNININNNDLLQRVLPTRRLLFTSSSPYYSSSSPFSTLLPSTTKTTMPQPPSPIQEDGGSFQRSFHPNLKGVFAGSGTDGLSDPRMVDTILDLLPLSSKEKLTAAAAALALAAKLKNSTSNNNNNNTTNENANENNDVNVLYLGTATYDIPKFKLKQTKCFIQRGCKVQSLDIAFDNDDDSKDDNKANNNKALIENADIIVVGGGNTLFAVDRWYKKGLIPILKNAMERGCILTGGSAGAICWFHSGHSDSADPDTYVTAMLQKYNDENDDAVVSCSTSYDTTSNSTKTKKEWNYIRVPGLNFIPNVICCPHHDKVQSNGLLRSNDFDTMLLKLAAANKTTTNTAAAVQSSQSQQSAVNNNSNSNNIIGIGIDHYAALIVDGDQYRVFSLQDKVGSIPPNSNNTWNDDEEKKQDGGSDFAVNDKGIATGTPGIWIKRIVRTTDTTKNDNNNNNNGNNSKNNFTIDAQILPLEGKLKDIIHTSSPSSTIDDDTIDIDDIDIDNKNELERCRTENPSS